MPRNQRSTSRHVPPLAWLIALSCMALSSLPLQAAQPLAGRVLQVQGSDGVSTLYRYQFDISARPDLDIAALIGVEGHFPLNTQPLHGVVTQAEAMGRVGSDTVYRITLEPAAAALGLRVRSRVFREYTVPDLIAEVLAQPSLAEANRAPVAQRIQLLLNQSHPVLSTIAQYRESDWAFVARLMQQSGLSFHFVHAEDRHTMLIHDGPPAGTPARLPFDPKAGPVTQVSRVARLHGGAVALADYDFTHPQNELTATAQVSRFATLTHSEHDAGFRNSGEGQLLAATRLQELVGTRGHLQCRTNTPLVSGQIVEIAGHPEGRVNGTYVVAGVEHAQTRDGYANTVTLLPRGERLVPRRTLAAPTIAGVQVATVAGPAGSESHVNEYGNVQLHLPWDENESHTGWVRVAHPSWVDLRLPRVGDEVLVAFEQGDPARPVVLGSLFNAAAMPPYALPDSKTVTTLRTRTTPGGGGYNELMLGDAAGDELVRLRAQKDLFSHVLNDETRKIENDQSVEVANHQVLSVGNNQTISVDSNQSEQVGGQQSLLVGGDRNLTVGHDQTITVANNSSTNATRISLTAAQRIELRVGSQSIIIDGNGVHLSKPQAPARAPSRTTPILKQPTR